MPALVEADDDGLYVVKLLGAGHGRKALIAEVLEGELARRLGLPVPDRAVELDAALAKAEPEPEIQDLLERSAGRTWGSTSCPAPCRSRRPWARARSRGCGGHRLARRAARPTWIGRRATRTCSSGTGACT